MPFQPGNPGKPKGAMNKISRDVKDCVGLFLQAKLKDLDYLYDSLEPEQKLEFISKVFPYFMAKLNNNEVSGDIQAEIKVTWSKPWENGVLNSSNESSSSNGRSH